MPFFTKALIEIIELWSETSVAKTFNTYDNACIDKRHCECSNCKLCSSYFVNLFDPSFNAIKWPPICDIIHQHNTLQVHIQTRDNNCCVTLYSCKITYMWSINLPHNMAKHSQLQSPAQKFRTYLLTTGSFSDWGVFQSCNLTHTIWSRVFHPRIFHGPAFSIPAFSVAPYQSK